jgi:flagellar hook-basal body complex protein FliE
MAIGNISETAKMIRGIGGAGESQGLERDRKLDSFSETLVKAGQQIAAPQVDAQRAMDSFAKGMDGRIHETMITVEKADISLKYMVAVRNKLIEAYKEIMRMGA